MRQLPPVLLFSSILLTSCNAATISQPPARTMEEFADNLEKLRTSSQIPGISVAMAKDNAVVWKHGFGFADIATARLVTPATAFHLASLTKPFAATVILQLVEQGLVRLDDPVAQYGVDLPGSTPILVRHLMTHTSEGIPGTVFRYNGNRFSLLDSVITRTTHRSFAQQLANQILAPLRLAHTAPNNLSVPDFPVAGIDRIAFEDNLAQGYVMSGNTAVATAYPRSFSTAAGLIASASDVAEFSIATDQNRFLQPATKDLMFTAARTPSGEVLPYGLGWFVTERNGVKIVWHYGLWTAISALIIKVPDRGLTFVVLANSPALNDRYDIIGSLFNSPWANAFLDTFVFGSAAVTNVGSQ